MRRPVAVLAALALLLSGTGTVLADGCFFKGAGRFEAPPPIPAQRALVIHRDGVERLVVESTLDVAGQTFGWVLPVPARPTEVKEVTPGALDVLDLATRPAIRSGGSFEVILYPAGLLLLVVVALRLFLTKWNPQSRERRLVELLVFACLLLLFAAILVPNLLSAKLGMAGVEIPGVTASDPQRVGNYEVVVLEARDAGALGKWLEGNGLSAVPAAGVPVVADYVARGWVFVAARLVREGSGPAAPHPICVVFPSEKPVYPMRLTALAGGTTDLRIHVASAGSASCPPLAVRFSGEFAATRDHPYFHYDGDPLPMLTHGGSWEGRRVAHPFLLEHLWAGCVITRLEGSMAAASMDRDIVLEVGKVAPYEHVLYTPSEAWRESLGTVAWFWALALLVLTFIPDERLPRLGYRGTPYFGWMVLLTAVAGAAAAALRIPLPTIPEESLLTPRKPFHYWRKGWDILGESDGYAGKPLAEVRTFLEGEFRRRILMNPFTGKPTRWGDSPGDVQLLEDHRGPVLRIWTIEGAPVDRAWFPERIQRFLYWQGGCKALHAAGIEESRRRLFPEGTLLDGPLNPFTGKPIRHGREPGDCEVVEVEGRVAFRAWFREGKSMDSRHP